MKAAQTYDSIKNEFEKDHFLCVGDSKFYCTSDGHPQPMSKDDMKVSYKHIKYDKLKPDGSMTRSSFITDWIEEEHIRRYQWIGLVLPPNTTPEGTYNVWDQTGFAVAKINPEDLNEEDKKGLQYILDHISMICDNSPDNFNFVLNWLAFMFQFPGYKNDIAIYIKTKPGLGKNLTIEFLEQLIGSNYVLCTEKPEEHLFGTFNKLILNKLFLVIDN